MADFFRDVCRLVYSKTVLLLVLVIFSTNHSLFLWGSVALRYKTAEGKKENKFGFGGKPQGAAFARKIVDTGQKVSGGSNGPMLYAFICHCMYK